jgi:hypothetical protein
MGSSRTHTRTHPQSLLERRPLAVEHARADDDLAGTVQLRGKLLDRATLRAIDGCQRTTVRGDACAHVHTSRIPILIFHLVEARSERGKLLLRRGERRCNLVASLLLHKIK